MTCAGTAATRMADLGVLPHVIEQILNHVSGHKSGVAGVYNRALYANEKRQALDLWAAHVEALIAGKPRQQRHSYAEGVTRHATRPGSANLPAKSRALRKTPQPAGAS